LVNEIGQAGWNALHFAVFLGYIDVVKFLFPLGADPNTVSLDGWTPLQLAIHKNHIESRGLLLF
jgi:ankyrin repeat protein